jgi:hypothetical protein
MMKNVLLVCSVILLLAVPARARAQYDKYKALYIYNFTKRIDWPDDQKNGDFIMGVMGKGNIVKHLKGFTQNKKVISQPIEVRQFQSSDAIDTCHLLFITDRYEDKTPVLVKKYADMPVLIITEASDSGGDINFMETEKALLFQINAKSIRSKNLKVSQSLINLGIEIDDGT